MNDAPIYLAIKQGVDDFDGGGIIWALAINMTSGARLVVNPRIEYVPSHMTKDGQRFRMDYRLFDISSNKEVFLNDRNVEYVCFLFEDDLAALADQYGLDS